ncbi:MAG: hypothetical protein F6K18_20750 [Okeania sp. SIO2C2]|nr:hypothetical protein [Okeania sp. SIO2C2]NEP89061.1 hypothetical protein [Okeania sp. SIO2C2]
MELQGLMCEYVVHRRSQSSGEKKEEGRGRTGEEGESFFITNYPDMI